MFAPVNIETGRDPTSHNGNEVIMQAIESKNRSVCSVVFVYLESRGGLVYYVRPEVHCEG